MAAVGITNQRETLVVWERATGRPVHRALVWQDQRGAALCARLAAEAGGAGGLGADRFRAKTGLPLVPYFSASKLAWLLDEGVPGLRARAERGEVLFGTVDTFLLWRMTGGRVHATDVTNASRTLLFNIHTLAWDEELLAAFGVPAAMLPQVRPSSHVFGACGAQGAGAEPDLDTACAPLAALEGVPVGGILGDQQAALFGQACFAPGDAKNTFGTGCFLLMNTGAEAVASRSGLLTTVAYQLEGQRGATYALEGSVAVGGSLVSWLRDNLGLIGSAAESEALAASVPDSAGCVFVPAFNGLFAPHWRSDARGVITGVSGHTRRAHVVRAALESVAFQSLELVRAMDADRAGGGGGSTGGARQALRVDGGMVANSLLMQFQADVAGRAVVRPVVTETTALGAAYAAGLAVGFWRDLAELKAQWRADRTWQPQMPREEASRRVAAWDRAVQKSLP